MKEHSSLDLILVNSEQQNRINKGLEMAFAQAYPRRKESLRALSILDRLISDAKFRVHTNLYRQVLKDVGRICALFLPKLRHINQACSTVSSSVLSSRYDEVAPGSW